MKKNVFVLFVLCNVLELCAAFTPDRFPQDSRKQSPRVRVKQLIGKTHYFMPTSRYFAHAASLVKPLSHCLGIIGVAAFSTHGLDNLRRAATLAPLDSKKNIEDSVMSIHDVFREISKKRAEYVKYQITLAIICRGQVSIGHAYGMYTPEPIMKFEKYNVAQINGDQLSVPLKVVGKKAILSDLTLHLLQKGDYLTAHELLSAAEQKERCITYGGILHINIPACLALFK